jgi:hypothetical protein
LQPKDGLHDFRDTYNVVLGEAGIEKATRNRLIGHGEKDTTERHYDCLKPRHKREVVEALERVCGTLMAHHGKNRPETAVAMA